MLNVFIAGSYIIIYTSISFISYILCIFLYPVRSCSDTSQSRENSHSIWNFKTSEEILLFFFLFNYTSSRIITSFSVHGSCTTPCMYAREK